MSNKDYTDLMDDLFNANQMLEMCHGYTQSDVPNMETLSNALYELVQRYTDVYLSLATNNDYIAKKDEVKG